MPALSPICENAVVEPKQGNKLPKRRTRSTVSIQLESSPPSNKRKSAVRRSRRRRKSTVHGLENIYQLSEMNHQEEEHEQNQQQQPQQQQSDEGNRWAGAWQDSAPSAPNRGPASPPAPINENEMQTDSTSSIDAGMSVANFPSSTVSNSDTATPKGTQAIDAVLSAEDETKETEIAKETETLAKIESEYLKPNSPTAISSPDGKAESRSRPKSRLSLLLTLRPPQSTPSSILRRRVAPVEERASEDGSKDDASEEGKKGEDETKKAAYNDGTNLEELVSNPTSDRHFDVLADFEASAIPQTTTTIRKTAAGDEVLVIGFDTLRERLNTLFPELFPKPSETAPTRRRGRSASTEISSQPPCIFPRLIACYTIYRDHQRDTNISSASCSETERSPKRRRTLDGMEEIEATVSSYETVESLSVIQNLLQKLVDLERIILEGHEHRHADEGTITPTISESNISAVQSFWRTVQRPAPNGNRKRRRVQFAAFDDKAVVRAPSDVLEGSYKPQENCIKALLSVLNAAEELFPHAVSTSQKPSTLDITDRSPFSNAVAIVHDFIFYLNEEFIPQCHDTICVESLMTIEKQNIPIERVQKAAFVYSRDLDSLINPEGKTIKQLHAFALANDVEPKDESIVVPLSLKTFDVFLPSRPLIWESKMADAAAQHIRFWLRTLLNEQPERVDADTKTDQWKTRLCDYVTVMELEEDLELKNVTINEYSNIYDEHNADRSIPIEEDDCTGEENEVEKDFPNIASLMSNVLSYIYYYLKLDADDSALSEQCLSWKDRLQRVSPDETCCATTVCREGFGTKRKPVYLTEEDWQDLREELEAGSYFVGFHRRALFAERLFSVLEALDMTDQWEKTVQATAQKLLNMKGAIQSEDEHLVLLAMSPRELLVRLRTEILPMTCDLYQICRANMRKTGKNFRLGWKNTANKKKFQPDVGNLESYWLNYLYPGTIFESISYIVEDE